MPQALPWQVSAFSNPALYTLGDECMRSFGLEKADSATLLYGRVLWPSDDLSTSHLYDDLGVVISPQGFVVDRGESKALINRHPEAQAIELEGVLAPAFADLHLHWVQHQVMGEYAGALLPWLHGAIFPAEGKLVDPHARAEAADVFWRDMLACGTLAASIYASSMEASVDACLERAVGMHLCGDSLMTQDCDPPLKRDPEETLAGVKRLAERWGDGYVVTPRFALSVSEELMALVGGFARQQGLCVQTHLSENPDEIKAVRERFPHASSYAEVYEHAGLLHERCILAHCIHLDEEEWALLRRRRCLIAHCPSSNIALGSGRMDLAKARASGVDWTLATDIGAGPDLSQFDTIRAFIEQHQHECDVSFAEGFARASVSAIPERFAPKKGVPACLIELPATREDHAESYLQSLVERYQEAPHDRAALIKRAWFGNRMVVGE